MGPGDPILKHFLLKRAGGIEKKDEEPIVFAFWPLGYG